MLLTAACQKEAAQIEKPVAAAQHVITSSSIAGVVMKKDGNPYPSIQSSNSFGIDYIGWSLNLNESSSGIKKETTGPVSGLGNSNAYCGAIKTIPLYAGQNILMGTLAYANDANNLYVTYTVDSDWYISEAHLYVGSLGAAPLSGGGTPSPGRFPIKSIFSSQSLAQTVDYTIPLPSFIHSNFIIAAHASVLRVDVDGDIVAKETAWAGGTRFQSNKNWATYIVGALGSCQWEGG